MKANELMIGDLLYDKVNDYYGEVTGVIDNGEIYIDGVIAYVSDFIPILITPEILEKNGFRIEIAEYTPDWKRCILNPNFFLEDRLKGCYHFNGNNLAKINYVHELQHALKLCGIEKNIII